MSSVNFLNSIILQVNVPVLSENTYSTYPSCSFKFEDYARIYTYYSSSYIIISYCINNPYHNFVISILNRRDIGTKFVIIKIHVPIN